MKTRYTPLILKRLLSLLIVAAMFAAMLPVTTFATGTPGSFINWASLSGSVSIPANAGSVLTVNGSSTGPQTTYVIDRAPQGSHRYHNFDIYYAGGNDTITITPALDNGATITGAQVINSGGTYGVSNPQVVSGTSITASIDSSALYQWGGSAQIEMTLNDSHSDEKYTIRIQGVTRVTVGAVTNGSVYTPSPITIPNKPSKSRGKVV